MKFFAAALLALAAAGLKLKEEGGSHDEPKHDGPQEGEDGGFPFPPPECGDKPEGTEDMTPADHFAAADTNGNESIDAVEGFEALFCAVVWGEMK